jgi:hypothetical protein
LNNSPLYDIDRQGQMIEFFLCILNFLTHLL